MSMMDSAKELYKVEASEHLASIEDALLELEEKPGDIELISRIFRSMHTIKGSGAMFGFDDIAAFTHEVETIFDRVRSGSIPVGKDLINSTLRARDMIKTMLAAADGGPRADEREKAEIIASLKNLSADCGEKTEAAAAVASAPADKAVKSGEATYRIRFRPSPDIFRFGTNPVGLLNELGAMGGCRVIGHSDRIPTLEEITPEECYVWWDVILTTSYGIDAIKDVFVFVEDCSEIKIDVIDPDGGLNDDASYKKLGEILVDRGDLSEEDLKAVLAEKKPIGEVLVASGLASPENVQAALAEQQQVRTAREKKAEADAASSIRVPSLKLDTLVNLVGELVTVHARLSQAASKLENEEMIAIAEDVERLMWELRENTMNIRMLPIGTTFSRFKRLVHDLSAELGKDIELTTEGAETELDKTVIERLNDPMVHLIRNSIDHGIEKPADREASGKPAKGTIHLAAVHSGSHVMIEIRDDGAGLDVEAIRAKGIERGLIKQEAELSEKEIFQLIFAPGFSTAKTVTSVSGRGVGMDVVKRGIESLRGTVEIESLRGKGSSIRIRLPLTLAIIDGFLVRVENEYFVIPLSVVSECMELPSGTENGSGRRDIVNVRGGIVPYIRLRERFSMGVSDRPEIEHLVITEAEGKRVGFAADEIIGEHQTVIKNLGRFYDDIEGVSGATILGDGTVALILDIPKLISQVATG